MVERIMEMALDRAVEAFEIHMEANLNQGLYPI